MILTQQKVKSLLDEGGICSRQSSVFYQGVRCFFEAAVEYSLAHFPLDDEVLINASIVNFESRLEADLMQVEYFVNRYTTFIVHIIITIAGTVLYYHSHPPWRCCYCLKN